jgi:hypothetical protein
MLPTLIEMMDCNLLTPEEAIEANSYASSDPQKWLSMPRPLMERVWSAWNLLSFNPDQSPMQ